MLVSPPDTCTAAGWRPLPTHPLLCCTAAPHHSSEQCRKSTGRVGGWGCHIMLFRAVRLTQHYCGAITPSTYTAAAGLLLQLDCCCVSAAGHAAHPTKMDCVISLQPTEVTTSSLHIPFLVVSLSYMCQSVCCSLHPYLGVSTTAYALQGSCLTSKGCKGAAAAAACAAYTNCSTGAWASLHVLS